MYGWGGDDTSNWRGSGKYSFDSARKPYLDKLASAAASKGPRTYSRRREPDLGLVDPKGKRISSDSKNPIVLSVDVTGSMASWPGEIFDRLPLLYQTLSQYREDAEFCFAAIGDAYCDDFPLQVNDFDKGLKLEDNVKALGCEGGGGGQVSESYELFGHFMLERCETPKATSPFLFIYGDEKFYNKIDSGQVQHYMGGTLQGSGDSKEMWKKLTQKFNMYFLHKPYGHGGDTSTDREVVAHWADAIGEQRIIEIPSMDRAVDIAMGIVAKHWGQYGNFKDNLSARQSDEGLKDSVYASLRHIPDTGTTNSVMAKSRGGSTKSLSEMFDSAKSGKSRRGR